MRCTLEKITHKYALQEILQIKETLPNYQRYLADFILLHVVDVLPQNKKHARQQQHNPFQPTIRYWEQTHSILRYHCETKKRIFSKKNHQNNKKLISYGQPKTIQTPLDFLQLKDIANYLTWCDLQSKLLCNPK